MNHKFNLSQHLVSNVVSSAPTATSSDNGVLILVTSR